MHTLLLGLKSSLKILFENFHMKEDQTNMYIGDKYLYKDIPNYETKEKIW